MTTYVYSQGRPPKGLGQFAFRNPRFFNGVPKDASAAYVLDTSMQADAVRANYRAAGIPVLDPTGLRLDSDNPDPGAVIIPDDWRELPWTQQGDLQGETLRGIASAVSVSPIKNKAQAIDAIEAELSRRADDAE